MAEIGFPPIPAGALANAIYASSGEALVGLNSSARATMLPAGQPGSSLLVRAGRMPVGSALVIQGTGLIGAATAAPGTFILTPHVTPAGGSKADLPGFSQAPLLGADGFCAIWLVFLQTATGIQTAGVTNYGVQGQQAYSISINPGAIGTQPTIVASDPGVDRTFGVDGQWATANAANYCRPRLVTATLIPAGGA